MKIAKMSDLLIYKMEKAGIEEALLKSQQERVEEKYSCCDNLELLRNEELRDILMTFKEVFRRSFSEEQTLHMYYKLKFLRVRKDTSSRLFGMYLSLGHYDSNNNIITIVGLDHPKVTSFLQEETYYHELLHMASTVRTKEARYVGFEIPDVIGRKLNEGYTEYLTRKYFTRKNNYTHTSNIDIIFAKGVENIIGVKKMQEYYFTGNLNGLVEELSQYTKRENVIKLLFLMDQLDTKFKTEKDIEDIIQEIANLNQKKLEKDFKEGKISEDEFEMKYIMNVKHYQVRNLWSDQSQVVEEKDGFYIEDQGFKSKYYKKICQ